VVNPDSNPTLSLSVYMFFAPALLWIGTGLLLLRLRGRAFARLARGRARRRSDFLIQSAARRGASLNRGLLLLGLLLAFGVEVGVFAATYDRQARVDAELTLGADVVAQSPTLAARRIAQVPGVAAASGVDHAYAYVGPDLQDMFGIDPGTIGKATTLSDSYFLGGPTRVQLARLRRRPDAVLVSKETITDYSLNLGDLLKLRVLDHRTGRFRVVPFHVTGIVQEFPSAPRDSFMVGNLSYLLAVTHDPGANVVFIRASGDPGAVARRVASAFPAASVKNIRQQAVQTASSITTVDLNGISRIEGAFAILLAAATMVLLATVAVAERRHELATMAALGAAVRELALFVWTELALVLIAGAALAALLGWLLAEMLIAMLQHVFDPPPDHLTVPWAFLAALGAAASISALAGALVAYRSIARLQLGAILREE
jgi:putative ABC transport system permease protein